MEPVCILQCEPPQAHSLDWLPLAVRFKLDAAGLKIRLSEWQALGRDERQSLVACPTGGDFEPMLLGCVPQARRIPPSGGSYEDYLLAKLAIDLRASG